jgi:L-seryl-tRNA(Ser) seleniumtransferase
MSARKKSISEPEETLDARLRALPSVTAILNTAAAVELVQRFGRTVSTEAVRATVDDARTTIKAGAPAPDADHVARQTLARLDAHDGSSLRPGCREA